MKTGIFTTGVVLFFASLWIGGWAVGTYGAEHWSNFPTIITTFLMCLAGVVLVVLPFNLEDAP